jgi:hypothetical protein
MRQQIRQSAGLSEGSLRPCDHCRLRIGEAHWAYSGGRWPIGFSGSSLASPSRGFSLSLIRGKAERRTSRRATPWRVILFRTRQRPTRSLPNCFRRRPNTTSSRHCPSLDNHERRILPESYPLCPVAATRTPQPEPCHQQSLIVLSDTLCLPVAPSLEFRHVIDDHAVWVKCGHFFVVGH